MFKLSDNSSDVIKCNNVSDVEVGISDYEALGEVAKIKLDDLWERAKTNVTLLDSCKMHNFNIPIEDNNNPPMIRKYKCSNCGGEVLHDTKYWYELGLKHTFDKK